MKPSVYLETSIISYLAAWPSRDLIVAANQQATHEWWRTRQADFDLIVSDVVADEISQGDPAAAKRRLDLVRGLRVITPGASETVLARALASELRLPRRAGVDALHIALAATHGIPYLLTWNCSHIANATLRPGIESVCQRRGYAAPVICTPPELM